MPKMTKAEKAAEKAKREARLQEANNQVRSGKCPQCGCGLRRNLALTGWWQCEQYGTTGFRKDDNKPPCSWQTFTE